MRARDVFMAVMEGKDSLERNRILAEQCRDDAALRRDVELLLQQHERNETFILDAAPSDEDATDASEVIERPGSIVGSYKLLQEIGEGGMGVVFMAEQSAPIQRMVALKIIKPGMDSRQVIARFEAERQTLALMDHPNIARVLDAGSSPKGRPYFVMELVKGLPITKYCDEHHLTLVQRLELFKSVCQAVQHAHQKGVIHRDIKPSNVLVAEYDHQAVPKIIDFGVAKAMGFKLTERTMFTGLGQVLGTLEYMSPEQAKLNQLDIDTRSDIYSLGVLLYELLTGSTPFERKRLREAAYDEVLRIIREEEPPKPSTRVSTAAELPAIANNRGAEPKKLSGLMRGELDWVVMRALEKDRNRRYETANGLAMDIQRYLTGEPVSAHPPSTAYRFKKFLGKRRGPVAAALLVLLALVGGIVGTTMGMFRANRAETKAINDRNAALAARKEAFEVLTDLTDNSVGTLLAHNPVLSPQQREFLERVVARYERLAEGMTAGEDAESMRSRSLEQVGITYVTLGDYQRATEVLKQASDALRRLTLEQPDNPEWVWRLADCLNYRSVAYERMQHLEQRNQIADEALAVAEAGLKRFGTDREIALSVAILFSNRASNRWSDVEGRELDIRRSIEVARSLVALDGAEPRGRRTLAVGLGQLTAHYASLKDVDRAHATLEEIQALVDGIGLDGDRILGEAYSKLAWALDQTNQQEAAIAAYRIGIDYLEQESAKNPGDSSIMKDLLDYCQAFERLLRRVGRDAEAAVYYRRANALAENSIERARGESASLATYIDLNAAVARSHWAAGRSAEFQKAMDGLVAAGRQLVHARPEPLIENGRVDVAEAKRSSHRFRQLVDTCNDANRIDDAIYFGKQQEKFVQAVIAQGEPMSDELFVLLQSTQWGLTRAYLSAGRFEDALRHWEKMVDVTAWDEPANAREDACLYISDSSRELAAAGLTADPAAILGPQIDAHHAQLAQQPDELFVRTKLLRAHRVLGLTLEFLHRFAEAVEWNARAITLMGTPIPAHTDLSPTDAEHLSQIFLAQAVCLDAIADEKRAEQAWAKSREFSGERFQAFEFLNRAAKMARNGQGEKGVRLIEQQLATAGADLNLRYNAACVYALASAETNATPERSLELAQRAIELLHECRNQKYFEDAGQRGNLHTDPDLAEIRDHEDFQKLLSNLTAEATSQ